VQTSAAKEGQGPKGSPPAKDTGRDGGSNKKKHPPLELPTGKPEEGPTKAQQARVPTADINLSVAGDGSEGGIGSLPAAYTCDGKDISPPISWQNVPIGTAELAIFALNLLPVGGKLHVDWAVAGIDPSMDGLKAGELPAGAVVGGNGAGGNGYSICTAGAPETYVFALYALPKSLAPKSGFDPLSLRKEATRMSDSVGLYTVSYGS
jgi:phosphatidylethanolamine-binding protein (PEBP) family uncharacterized protein